MSELLIDLKYLLASLDTIMSVGKASAPTLQTYDTKPSQTDVVKSKLSDAQMLINKITKEFSATDRCNLIYRIIKDTFEQSRGNDKSIGHRSLVTVIDFMFDEVIDSQDAEKIVSSLLELGVLKQKPQEECKKSEKAEYFRSKVIADNYETFKQLATADRSSNAKPAIDAAAERSYRILGRRVEQHIKQELLKKQDS